MDDRIEIADKIIEYVRVGDDLGWSLDYSKFVEGLAQTLDGVYNSGFADGMNAQGMSCKNAQGEPGEPGIDK